MFTVIIKAPAVIESEPGGIKSNASGVFAKMSFGRVGTGDVHRDFSAVLREAVNDGGCLVFLAVHLHDAVDGREIVII